MPYYPALDSLRFFAAFAVLVAHIFVYLDKYRHPSMVEWLFRFPVSDLAVKFFFVLSAFLITRILVSDTSTIGRFYMRRIFRIWPVYFVTLVTGAALLTFFPGLAWSHAPLATREQIPMAAALYIFFLPNYVNFLYGSMPFLAHLWTIGLEEQFYLVWPPLLRAGKKRVWFWALPITLVSLLFLRRYVGDVGLLGAMIVNQPLETLLIGSFAGFAAPVAGKSLKRMQTASLALVAMLVLCPVGLYPWSARLNTTVVSMAFAALVFAYATPDRTWLDRPALKFLGRISYGIYMYHVLVLILAIRGLENLTFLVESPVLFFAAVAITGTVGTLAVASLSWRYLEQPMIGIGRRRFGAVPRAREESSTDAATDFAPTRKTAEVP